MVWSFTEAENYLNDTAPPGKSIYGLGRINHLLDILGHPENGFKCVTVVGTNGKGSTIAFLDSLLLAHGVKVACHIKPHLESVTERIRINGIDSTQEEFASAMWEVKNAIDSGWIREDKATYFELIFAAFLCAAGNADVDIALLEAGLGGRLDAVNSIDADLVVLTSVSYDHTELLGETLREITGEKIAVLRPGSTLVVQENPKEVLDVIEAHEYRDGIQVIHNTGRVDDLELGLNGPFQPLNASLALLAFGEIRKKVLPEFFVDGADPELVKSGLKNARIPGRWEEFEFGDGIRWIIDGAHNESALDVILNRFRDEACGEGVVLFGLKKTKSVDGIIPALMQTSRRIVLVEIPYFASWMPDDLKSRILGIMSGKKGLSQIQIVCADSIKKGIEIASEMSVGKNPVLVTGSLYLVGEVRKILREKYGIMIQGECTGV